MLSKDEFACVKRPGAGHKAAQQISRMKLQQMLTSSEDPESDRTCRCEVSEQGQTPQSLAPCSQRTSVRQTQLSTGVRRALPGHPPPGREQRAMAPSGEGLIRFSGKTHHHSEPSVFSSQDLNRRKFLGQRAVKEKGPSSRRGLGCNWYLCLPPLAAGAPGREPRNPEDTGFIFFMYYFLSPQAANGISRPL